MALLSDILNKATSQSRLEENFKDKSDRETKKKRFSQIEPTEKLNDEQYKACFSEEKRNIVIASAGTGKTSTIIARVYNLIKNKNIEPSKIILLTFTSKAGKEMLERLKFYFSDEIVSQIFAGTFHSFGKKQMENFEKKHPALLSDKNIQKLLYSLYQKFSQSYSVDSKDSKINPSTLLQKYNFFRNKQGSKDLNIFLSFLIEEYKEKIEELEYDFYIRVIEEYEIEKERHNLVDFTDYLIFLTKHKRLKGAYEEVIVDEYQDSNKLQNLIISNLITDNTSLFCVGDYDQSIYSFNGSDINFILNFPNMYKNAKILYLNKNYRSSPSIIKLSEKVIANNPRYFEKSIQAMVKNNPYTPEHKRFARGFEELQFIANEISSLKYDINDIAIIYRSNVVGDRIENILLEHKIPVDRKDNKNFLMAQDIQFFLSVIKFSLVKNVDLFVFFDIFAYSDIKEKDIKNIYEIAKILGNGDLKRGIFNPDLSLVKKLPKSQQDAYKHKTPFQNNSKFKKLGDSKNIFQISRVTNIDNFLTVITMLHSTITLKTPYQIIEAIEKSYFYKNVILKKLAKKRAFFVDDETVQTAEKFYMSRVEILKGIAKENNSVKDIITKEKLSNISSDEEKHGVKLLTAHASKGLEYKVVFISHLSDIKFPNKKLVDSGGSIEEERRLMYVAITRAKEKLYLLSSNIYTNKTEKPSRFLREAGFL